jgi:phosphate-selective porin OprO and OprP
MLALLVSHRRRFPVRLNVSCSVVALVGLLVAGPAAAQQPQGPKAPKAPKAPVAKPIGKLPLAPAAKPAAPAIDHVKADLDKLKAEVEASRRELVQVPVALTALDQLAAEVSTMRAEIERLAAMRAAESDLRRALDGVRTELEEARAQIGELRARVDQPPPEYPLPGGVGRDHRGFYLRTEDATFELRISGYLQAGYEGAYRTTTMADETPGTYDQWRNLSAFNLRRAKLLVGGFVLRPELSYFVELDLAKMYQRDYLVWHDQTNRLTSLRSPLEDAWVEVAVRKWLVARAGQFRVPFGHEHQIQESKLHLVDTSVVDRSFSFDRDLGVMLHGTCPREKLGWQAAVMNGTGPNRLHDTGDLLYVARLLGAPLGQVITASPDRMCNCKPHLTLGLSFAYRRARLDGGFGAVAGSAGLGSLAQVVAPALDRVDIYQVGAELALKWKRLTLLGEYVWRHQKNKWQTVETTFYPGQGFGADYWGAYGQAGFYAIRERLEVVARYAFAEPHGYGLSAWEQEQLPRAVHEGTLGFNYFHAGHSAKIMLDGSYILERGLAALGTDAAGYPLFDRKSGRVRLIVQLKF